MLGRANLLLSRGGLNGLAAFSVAGRNATASQVTSFVTETPFSGAFNLNKESSSVQKNVTRGFAAEAEPVAAAGKGAITQVRILLLLKEQTKKKKRIKGFLPNAQAPEKEQEIKNSTRFKNRTITRVNARAERDEVACYVVCECNRVSRGVVIIKGKLGLDEKETKGDPSATPPRNHL